MVNREEISFDEFRTLVAIPLFCFAIVNPMGPTFMVLAVGRISDGRSNLMFASLNPFSQTAESIKEYNFDANTIDYDNLFKEHSIADDINEFLVENWNSDSKHGTPTILCGGSFDSQDEEVLQKEIEILADIIMYSSNPVTTLSSLEKYPMNVIKRVSYEMENMFSHSPSTTTCGETELAKLLAIIINIEHLKQEFSGFLIAWNGSIDFQEKNGVKGLLDSFSFDEMIEFVNALFPGLIRRVMPK
jgi:hypothetical protein